jgi:hypothetical protein
MCLCCTGYDWTLIDSCYLIDVRSRLQVQEWRKFLSFLGVLDFLAVRQKDVTVSRTDLVMAFLLPCLSMIVV